MSCIKTDERSKRSGTPMAIMRESHHGRRLEEHGQAQPVVFERIRLVVSQLKNHFERELRFQKELERKNFSWEMWNGGGFCPTAWGVNHSLF